MALPTEPRERRLKIALLSYFKAGHSIAALGKDAGKFPGFTAAELQIAALGLRDAGFIKKVRGRTKDMVYQLTVDGAATLDLLEKMGD